MKNLSTISRRGNKFIYDEELAAAIAMKTVQERLDQAREERAATLLLCRSN